MSLSNVFRKGELITRERAQLWAAALLMGFAAALGYLFWTAHGLNDYSGRPLGSDFSNVYVAGGSALHGDPVSPFVPARQYQHEQAQFGPKTQFYGWHYPPYFLLIAAPLAALSYIPSLIVWQLATLALYLACLRWLLRAGPKPEIANDPLWLVLALAFPAVFMNLTHGHNGFLTTALLGGGLALLDSRAILSGVLFGLMIYKPQFGLMIPVLLIAERRWGTIIAAALTVCALTAVTTALFGPQVWNAFVHSLPFTRMVVLEQGGAGFYKIQSVFAWIRMWGGPVPLAYAMQAIAILGTGALLYRLGRSGASAARKGAALCIASLIATPYCFDYDMMALAPAIALLMADGLADGFRPYERFLAAALWSMPFLSRSVAEITAVPLGPMVMLLAFGIIVSNSSLAKRPQTERAASEEGELTLPTLLRPSAKALNPGALLD